MKIFFKIIVIFFIVNICFTFIIAAFIIFSTLPSSLRETNISFIDLIKDDLTEDEYNKLSEYTSKKSSELGSRAGKHFVTMLAYLFSIDDVSSYTEKKSIDYSVDTVDHILDENERRAEEAIKESLNEMNEYEKELNKIIQDSLNNTQN